MAPTRREVLSAVAVSAVSTGLAGCIGGDGGNQEPTDTGSPTGTSTPSPTDGPDAATVRVASHPDFGDVLVGPERLTLYMFDQDTQGEPASTCYDSCADAWPPLTVSGEPSSGDGVMASLGTFERDGGETQVTAGGWPLYYFASDEQPGDANGQGLNGVWWVLAPDGTPIRESGTETPSPTPSPTEGDGGGGGGGGGGYGGNY